TDTLTLQPKSLKRYHFLNWQQQRFVLKRRRIEAAPIEMQRECALTCQSTRTHNSTRRLRRKCWWSGHLYVMPQGNSRLRSALLYALMAGLAVLVILAVYRGGERVFGGL